MREVTTISFLGIKPLKAHASDAGYDLVANENVWLDPVWHSVTGRVRGRGHIGRVATGTVVGIPHGHVGLVCPRSGLAAEYGITVLNAPGVIDSGFRDEINVILVNLGSQGFMVAQGDRIAQLLIVPLAITQMVYTEGLDAEDTDRGQGGFGSTGGFGEAA